MRMDDNYAHFSALDFAQEPSFIRWVRTGDGEAAVAWQRWLSDHPDRAEDIAQARRLGRAQRCAVMARGLVVREHLARALGRVLCVHDRLREVVGKKNAGCTSKERPFFRWKKANPLSWKPLWAK